MTRLAIRIGGVFLCTLVAQAARAEVVIPSDTTAALRELLDARDEAGARLIGDDELSYFAGLPSHMRAIIAQKVAEEWITSTTHLNELLALGLGSANIAMAMEDGCLLCHTDAESQGEDTLFSRDPEASGSNDHLNLQNYISDVHFRQGLSCAGCHGGNPKGDMEHDHPKTWPEDASARAEDRSWVPGFCASCHSDTSYMRQYAPELPTDQFDKYKGSRHGRALLEEHNSKAAECTSCHGVHGIQGPQSPGSKIYPTRVPETCAACHTDATVMEGAVLPDGSPVPINQYEEYRSSVHGIALLERGDSGAPACNDCHGNHAAMPPELRSISQVCRTCHAHNGILFDGSRHKVVFDDNGWPECGSCHGKHAIAKPTDAMLGDKPGSMCRECHEQHARDNPLCAETSDYFQVKIAELVEAHELYEHEAERIATQGLDAEEIENQIITVADSLRQSRSSIHAFDVSVFDGAADPGFEAVAHLEKLVADADAEFRVRVAGLAMATVFIVLTMLLLWLKIRSLEAREEREAPHSEKS